MQVAHYNKHGIPVFRQPRRKRESLPPSKSKKREKVNPERFWWSAKGLRKTVLERDEFTCSYCGIFGIGTTIEHVMPESRGGENTPDNCVAACFGCNNSKGNRTLMEWVMGVKPDLSAQQLARRMQNMWG